MAHVWVDVKNARYAIKNITRIFVSLIGKSYKRTLRGCAAACGELKSEIILSLNRIRNISLHYYRKSL